MQRLIAKVPSLFFLQFPVLTHVGILIGNRSLSFLAFLLLTLGFCIQLIRVNRLYQIAAMVAASSVLSYLYLRGMTDWLVYVPPIFIPLFLTFFFGATLRRGRESIVTSIGERARGPLDDDMRAYTRKVTLVWTLVFLCLSLEALLLALIDQTIIWSWLVNIFNPLLIIVIFVGEFAYRKQRFPQHDHPRFIDYFSIARDGMKS